jgi:DNA-binding FadR family transcriptional regulator
MSPAGIAPFPHQTLHAQLADHLEHLIVSGEFDAGTPIPSERDLAERFQVSRAAVRDATRMLAARGLVEVRQGVGTIVTADGEKLYQSSLYLLFRRGHYTRADLLDLRRHIETELAARVCEQRSADAIAQLRSHIQAMQQAVDAGNRERAEARHREFHLALAQAAGNPALVDVMGPLISVTFELTMTDTLRTNKPVWSEYADHAELLECMEAGDVEGARRVMRRHLDAALRESHVAEREKKA